MRIALLQDDYPPFALGGSAAVAAAVAAAFAAKGHEVMVITTVRNARDAKESFENGVHVVRIASQYHERWRAWRGLFNPRAVREVGRLLAAFRPDAISAHSIDWHLSYASLAAAKRHARRVVFTAHSSMLYAYGKVADARRLSTLEKARFARLRYNPLRGIAIRHALAGVPIISVSSALAEALSANGFANTVIRNGIDPSVWACPPEAVAAFKEKHGIGDHAILFGGRLSRAKGGDQMLAALPLVLNEHPRAQLVVMGQKDAYAERMLQRAMREGIADHVVFTGWLTGAELRAAYHAVEVVAVPSLYLDPFPTVNLEAMACAKPVVATCLGGSKEAVENGVTGLVVDPRDTRALASALVGILQDSAPAKQFGEAGRARVREQFALTLQAERYLVLFDR